MKASTLSIQVDQVEAFSELLNNTEEYMRNRIESRIAEELAWNTLCATIDPQGKRQCSTAASSTTSGNRDALLSDGHGPHWEEAFEEALTIIKEMKP